MNYILFLSIEKTFITRTGNFEILSEFEEYIQAHWKFTQKSICTEDKSVLSLSIPIIFHANLLRYIRHFGLKQNERKSTSVTKQDQNSLRSIGSFEN